MTKLVLGIPLLVACAASPNLSNATQAVGCDGPDSYIDENGEEVICVYTDEPYDPPPEDPLAEHCALFPEMCVDDPPPPSGDGGGGDPPPDPAAETCTAPTAAQQRAYDTAMIHARCVIETGSCGALLAAPVPPAEAPVGDSPSRVLGDLAVKGHFKLGCPAKNTWVANTEGHGQASDAIIKIRPLFYTVAKAAQVVTILHELGHAMGRIGSEYDDHDGYYASDPGTSREWNERIAADCLHASIARCGNSWDWPDD